MPNRYGRNMLNPFAGNIPNIYGRNTRRQAGRGNNAGATVVTNRRDCCAPPETVSEEIYSGSQDAVLVEGCCDRRNGCIQMEAQTRCGYWPSFAHPRWLNCGELHNLKL